MGVINLGGEVGCMISEGPWLFVGIPNVVKVRFKANSLAIVSSLLCYLFWNQKNDGFLIFYSMTIILQAWNTQTNQELSLSGPVGQVYTMVVGNDLLFAGTQVMF